MKYKWAWLLFLSVFGVSQVLNAQTGRHCKHRLYGIVTDSETMEPLLYANVFIRSLNKGIVTGNNGEYQLDGLCDGKVVLTVSHVGCETTDYEVEIKEDTHFDVQLPHSKAHDTVHIYDEHPGPKPTQTDESLKGLELDKLKGKSLGDALSEIAGVDALQTGPSIFKPMIQGLHSNRVLVLNNGIRQEGQQWGSEHGPEIDPFIASKLTVVKGANGVRYGPDAIAGVVLVEPAPLRDSAGLGGRVDLVGMSNGRMGAASGMLEGNFAQLKPFSWRMQGTIKRGGDMHTPDYNLTNTGLREYNFSAAAGWQEKTWGVDVFYSQFNTDIGIFTGAHIGNLTDLELAIERDTPLVVRPFSYEIRRPFQHIEHELSKVRARMETGKAGELSLTYARQYNLRQEYDRHTLGIDPVINPPQLHYEITSHQAELMWSHEKWKGLRGQIGLTGQTQTNTYEGFFFIPNFRNYTSGAFLIERFVKLRWELEMGLRYDYRHLKIWMWENGAIINPEFNWSNVSGTIGGLYRISPHTSLRANIGTAWRPPGVNELFSNGLHHGAASVEIGDRSLDTEKALNSILTLRYNGHEKFSGTLSLYYNYIRDFIYLKPVLPPTLTIRGAFPTFHYTQVDAGFAGTDLSVSYSFLPGFRLEGKAAILRARNLTTNEYLILMPTDRFETRLTYTFADRNHLKAPFLTIGGSFNRRQNRVPANSDYAPPPEAYGLLNLEAGGTLTFGQQTLNLGFGAYNLTNMRYRNYMNRFRYYADEIGRNYSVRISVPFNMTFRKQNQLQL